MKSIRSQLLFYVSLAATISTLMILFSIWLHKNLSLKAEMKIESNKMIHSAVKQAEMIIPGLLLEEEYGAVAPQLDEIKKQENLTDIQYIPNGDAALDQLADCEKQNLGGHICFDLLNENLSTVTPIAVGSNSIGYLLKSKHVGIDFSAGWFSFLVLIITNFVIFVTLISSILWFMQSRICQPLQQMLVHYKESANDKAFDAHTIKIKELHEIAHKLNIAIEERQKTVQALAQNEIARQVAHDIRGPISLIEALVAKLKNQSSSQAEAELLSSVAHRIHTIADDLLEKHKLDTQITPPTPNTPETFTPFLQELEKRASLTGAKLSVDLCHLQSLEELPVSSLHLMRTVSNIYDNALQACKGVSDPLIHLSIRYNPIKKNVSITIDDNGRGIPPALVSKLGEKGFTWGKTNGNGLGLYQARMFCEQHGGHLEIKSRENKGSSVSLILPTNTQPKEIHNATELKEIS